MPEAQHGELVHAEHVARYLMTAPLAAGRRVLDVACGEGYGTDMLARAGAETAVGVDVDEPAIARATERYAGRVPLRGHRGAALRRRAFDLVVSFETIEHVTDAERALAELARVLAPGGLLVISTPNTHEYLVENEFHTREFSHEEFVAFLEQRFPSVRLLYQHNWMLSAILGEEGFGEGDESRPLELDVRKTVSLAPGRELYTVAAVWRRRRRLVRGPGSRGGRAPTRRTAWPAGWWSARRRRAAGTTSTRRPRTPRSSGTTRTSRRSSAPRRRGRTPAR